MTDVAAIEQSAEYRRLIEHLRLERDDETAWHVLGDLLDSLGHPRGALITLERQLLEAEGTPKHLKLLKARAELFSAHRDLLLGPRAVLTRHALTWHSGFVVEAGVARFDSHRDWVSALRTHESCTLLRELRVGAWLLAGYLVERGAPLESLVIVEPRVGRFAHVILTEAPHTPLSPPERYPDEPLPLLQVNEFSSYLPALRTLTFEDHVEVSVDELRPPSLEELVIAPLARVYGLSRLLAHRRLERLVLRGSLEYARGLAPETAPRCIVLEGNVALESGWILSLGKAGVGTLDLSQCKLDGNGMTELARGLRNVRGPLKVKLSGAMKRNAKVKAVLDEQQKKQPAR